jgi:hypothetical protein
MSHPEDAVRRGEFAFDPRGSHHTFANFSGAAARYLLVCTPAGFERYFDRITPSKTPSERRGGATS